MIDVNNVTKRYEIRHEGETTVLGTLINGLSNTSYETIHALNNVSMTCTPGTTTGLIGKNAAGKSTLLRCIAGIIEPTTGDIHVEGRVAPVLELGTGFHGELTGVDNCYLYGSLLGIPKTVITERIDDIFTTADIVKFKDTKVKHYSTGMVARLAFSIMTHMDPDVLILDEVFAVGDKDFRPMCEQTMHEFKQKGKTILIASHSLQLVEDYCDKVICMDDGEIIDRGTPDDVIDTYRSL